MSSHTHDQADAAPEQSFWRSRHGIVFIGFSSHEFIDPKVTESLADANTGEFTKAFYVAIAVVLLGLGLSLEYAKRKADDKLAAEIVQ